MPAYRISLGFFALKTNQKNRHFCMDFHLRRLSRKDYNQSLQKSRMVPPGIVKSLVFTQPLKLPQFFKPRIVIKTGSFVFLWIWPEPVRGSQRERKFPENVFESPKKNSPRFGLFYFSNLFPVLFDRFIVFTSCMLHSEVSRLKTAKY